MEMEKSRETILGWLRSLPAWYDELQLDDDTEVVVHADGCVTMLSEGEYVTILRDCSGLIEELHKRSRWSR